MVKSCRRQPDSGNPTVRDEKRAEQKRESRGTVNPPHKPKGCVTETLFLKLHALLFYSTNASEGIEPRNIQHCTGPRVSFPGSQ